MEEESSNIISTIIMTSTSAKTGTTSSSTSSGAFHSSSADAAPHPASAKSRPAASGSAPTSTSQQQPNYPPSSLSFSSSAAFQQVKQTQASLARLTRVHNQHHNNHQHLTSQTNQSSQQVSGKSDLSPNSNTAVSLPAVATATAVSKSTTFIDCLIRRFKDCFSEDFCTVPMFVVGNLSPGSDGK